MLFRKEMLEKIAEDKVSLAFRRWRRPGVKPGSRLHTPAGLLEIRAMAAVAESELTGKEAELAGYSSLPQLLNEVNAYSDQGTVYRIEFVRLGDDPREALREDDAIDEAQLSALRERLRRLDRASPSGPWTAEYLRLIDGNPAVRAAELAAAIGAETEKLKLNVRKLKNLGLTISLGTGYRISPRGQAYMELAGLRREEQ